MSREHELDCDKLGRVYIATLWARFIVRCAIFGMLPISVVAAAILLYVWAAGRSDDLLAAQLTVATLAGYLLSLAIILYLTFRSCNRVWKSIAYGFMTFVCFMGCAAFIQAVLTLLLSVKSPEPEDDFFALFDLHIMVPWIIGAGLLVIAVASFVWRSIRPQDVLGSLPTDRFGAIGLLGGPPALAVITKGRGRALLLFCIGIIALNAGWFTSMVAMPDDIAPEYASLAARFEYGIIIASTVLGILGIYIIWIAGKDIAVTAATSVKNDQAPPIVFLRSFKDDLVTFKPSWSDLIVQTLSGSIEHGVVNMQLWGVKEKDRAEGRAESGLRGTLDFMLFAHFSTYGPMVAIGSPNQTTSMFGVPRDFHQGDDWQIAVTDYCARASAIIVAVDDTPGLGWELDMLRAKGFVDKVLFIATDRFREAKRNADLWSYVFQRVGLAGTDGPMPDGQGAKGPATVDGAGICAVFTAPDGATCIARTRRFRRSGFHMAVRWFFRTRLER
jgi:hypothetical protein